MNDWDPTGYYTRKARKDAEFLDAALIPFFKWVGGGLLALMVLHSAFS